MRKLTKNEGHERKKPVSTFGSMPFFLLSWWVREGFEGDWKAGVVSLEKKKAKEALASKGLECATEREQHPLVEKTQCDVP